MPNSIQQNTITVSYIKYVGLCYITYNADLKGE
jgi:hypothetical protein